MDEISSKLIGNLHCLATDSILYGYAIDNCYSKSSIKEAYATGNLNGVIFASGHRETENNKALAVVDNILKEAGYLNDLSNKLDVEIKRIKWKKSDGQ
jgi:hypothetical protein